MFGEMYYVVMTDRFMSGWGPAADKINKLVISCNNKSEAEVVADNAKRRGEMKEVKVRATMPKFDSLYYHVSWHGRTQGDYETWFTPQWNWH